MMVRRIVLLGIWISFVVYTLWLAPLDQAETWAIARNLLTLQLGKVNAILVAIFSLMGVWPMIYACFMIADEGVQPFRVWPYFIGSNFTGVICLLPYLIFRQPNPKFHGWTPKWLQKLDQPSTGWTLLGITIALFAYALVAGDWRDYVYQFQTVPFVHLISLDFCLMGLIFPISDLLDDDMARRSIENPRWFWAVTLIPLFGPLFYLCRRPGLQHEFASNSSMASQGQSVAGRT